VSNLKESLQNKGIPTEVEGHKGYVGMNDEGVLMEGDKVPEDRRMMEKGDTGDTIFCWVLPSMVASSPMPLTCPVILTL
jgi:hypothetical protein